MDLTETMTLGTPPPREVDRDRDRERREQDQRKKGAQPCGSRREQRGSRDELGDRQDKGKRADPARRRAEGCDRPTRAREVSELGAPRHEEHGSECETESEDQRRHAMDSTGRLRTVRLDKRRYFRYALKFVLCRNRLLPTAFMNNLND